MRIPRESSVSAQTLSHERIGYIQFSVTQEGYFRCGGGEDRFGKDCDFRLYKTLSSLARHWQMHHYKTIAGPADLRFPK